MTKRAPSRQVEVSTEEPLRRFPESLEVSVHDTLLGSGGMATIQCARDRDLGREVAYKEVHDELVDDATARASFISEARITAQLDHPNIVPIYEFGRGRPSARSKRDPLFLTMKRINGRTLTEIIAARERREFQDREIFSLMQIFLKVCDAIGFAHSRGVIHRDIKPDNIMVGDYGEVYVLDWGVALLSSDAGASEAEGMIFGTPCYMSPEQAAARHSETDARSDIFSLGACLYEILTGSPPYGAGGSGSALATLSEAVACEVKPPGSVVDHALPLQLAKIAMRAMAPAPDDRYQSARELQADIETFLQTYSSFPKAAFGEGTLVFEEGDEAGAAYIIVAGQCEAFKTVDGREQHLRFLDAGDVFGEVAIFASRPRTASVRAVTDVTTIVISGQQIKDDNVHGYWISLLTRSLAERFLEKEREIDALEKKLARFERRRR